MLRGDAEGVDVGALGRDPELEAAVRLDPPGEVLRRGPRHPAPQADRLRGNKYYYSFTDTCDPNAIGWYLYPLLYEYVEALEDFVAVREALGGLVASLESGQVKVTEGLDTVLLATNLLF